MKDTKTSDDNTSLGKKRKRPTMKQTLLFPQPNQKMTWIEKAQDLFEVDQEMKHTASLAHCVSEDLKMGAGIAVAFKTKFGRGKDLVDQQIKVGDVAFLKRNERYIYYLVTKPKYYLKPTQKTYTAAMKKLLHYCVQHQVKTLLIPRLGCNLDRLDWDKFAKPLIKRLFQHTEITIIVCHPFQKKKS